MSSTSGSRQSNIVAQAFVGSPAERLRFGGAPICPRSTPSAERVRRKAASPRSPRRTTVAPIGACRTRPESGGPTRAGARRTTAECSPASRNRSSPSSSGRTGSCPRAPRRAPAAASVLASTYHWSVSQGSMTALERSPCGTVCACGSIFCQTPFRRHQADDALARLEAVDAVDRGEQARQLVIAGLEAVEECRDCLSAKRALPRPTH